MDFTEARDSEWQWHQLGCMQVCNSLQTDNHASNPSLHSVFTGRIPFLPPNQQRQSTEGILTDSRRISQTIVKINGSQYCLPVMQMSNKDTTQLSEQTALLPTAFS